MRISHNLPTDWQNPLLFNHFAPTLWLCPHCKSPRDVLEKPLSLVTPKGLDKYTQLPLVLIRWKGMFGKDPEATGRNKEGIEMLLNSSRLKDALWGSHTTGAKQLARAQLEPVHCSMPNNRYPRTAFEQDKHLAGISAVACAKRYAVGFRHASCGNLTNWLPCIIPATLIIDRNAPNPWQTRNELILLHNEQKKFIEAQSADKAG